MQAARLATLAASISLTLVGGCAGAPLADPEMAEYRRVDARLRAIDEFEAFKRTCRARGGVVYTNGSWGRLQPRVPDMGETRCLAPLSELR